MQSDNIFSSAANYHNPVYRRDFPDPFVWKFCGEYWAICTGFWHDGGAFGILHSRDLINWQDRGSALNPPPFPDAPCYWAPEVFYDNGKFYLYYSVGNEEFMEIRVAVAEHPAGEYIDSGHKLTAQQFAIDAHVFVDDDNSRWLFYATDFLDHSHIGTGTVGDRLISPFELAGNPKPVTRAKYDWQVYDPNRASKGNVRWHTIEGSSVLKRKGVYYQMFSGGNWQNISYGVSYAVTRDINQPDEWQQIADGEATLPILRTIPDKVIGPGHNSVVRGTDNRQLYCVYHRWAADLSGRQMAIDPLDFAGEKMIVLGATDEPQPAPNQPTFFDFFGGDTKQALGEKWESIDQDEWLAGDDSAISNPALENIETACKMSASSFLAEVSARAVKTSADYCGYGFCLKNKDEIALRCLILPNSNQVELSEQDEYGQFVFELPTDFKPEAFHLWRVEVNHFYVRLRLDEANLIIEKRLKIAPEKFGLCTQKMSAEFSGVAITVGFEDLFDWKETDLEAHGWQTEKTSPETWKIADNLLQCNSFEGESTLLKNLSLTDFELVLNACLKQSKTNQSCYGVTLKSESESNITLTIESEGASRFLRVFNQGETKSISLPADFDPQDFQQLRVRVKNDVLRVQSGMIVLDEFEIEPAKRQVGLFVRDAEAVFEMVRVTALSS
jgi:GH43 family beta-xylosidase